MSSKDMKLIMESWRKSSVIKESNLVKEQEIEEGAGALAIGGLIAALGGDGVVKIDGAGYIGADGLQKVQKVIDRFPDAGKDFDGDGKPDVTKQDLQQAFDSFTGEAQNNIKNQFGGTIDNFDWDKDGSENLVVSSVHNSAGGFDFPSPEEVTRSAQIPDMALGLLLDKYAQPEKQDVSKLDTDLEPGSVEYKMSTMDPEKKAELEKAMKDPRYQQWKANQKK